MEARINLFYNNCRSDERRKNVKKKVFAILAIMLFVLGVCLSKRPALSEKSS